MSKETTAKKLEVAEAPPEMPPEIAALNDQLKILTSRLGLMYHQRELMNQEIQKQESRVEALHQTVVSIQQKGN